MADDRLDGLRFRQAALTASSGRGDGEDPLSLTHRIRNEFEEMPGTCLTFEQACRLFGMPADVGSSILRQLVDEGVLSVTRDGRYRLQFSAA